MFEQTFVNGTGVVRKPWTVVVSFAGQAVFVAVIVIVPLLSTAKIGLMPSNIVYAPPRPVAQVHEVIQQTHATHAAPRPVFDVRLMAPRQVPEKSAAVIDDGPMLPPGMMPGISTGTPFTIGDGMTAAKPIAPPPPVMHDPPAVKASSVHVGGVVQAAKIVNMIKPAYPPLARSARVSGTVRLTAVIAKDGSIKNLQVIDGHPLLLQAALSAVKQWTYKPTQLNGEPVEVITEIDVNFTLAN